MPAVRRRTLGVLAGVGFLASGCSTDPPDPGGSGSVDGQLVDAVVAQIRSTREIAEASGKSEVVRVHSAHLAALGAPVLPSTAASTTTAAEPRDLVAAEHALLTTLIDGAVGAHSGSLARAFASMSAAISQQIGLLDD